jgi:hypothetical protein
MILIASDGPSDVAIVPRMHVLYFLSDSLQC